MSPGRLSAHGVTLVELLVSLVVLSVGILGLAASAGIVARQMRLSGLEARLSARASGALEGRLANAAATLMQSGFDSGAWVESRPSGTGLMEIRVIVAESSGQFHRADTLVTRVRTP
jgi:prepilin-type N-terminal cleavage/methylation domain-containing protein